MSSPSSSSCLGRAAVPVKWVWRGLSARLFGLRRATGRYRGGGRPADGDSGLGELHKEVRTCEYRDVHVMWEMLGGMEQDAPRRGDMAAAARKKKATTMSRRRRMRKAASASAAAAAPWSRLVSYCCAF